MKALSLIETQEWFTEHGYTNLGSPTASANALKLDFSKSSEIPAARGIVDQLRSDGAILLWIKNWSENSIFVHFPLWTRYCEAMGVDGDLNEHPALLFEKEERDDALAALILALHFSWNCSLFSSNGFAETHILENDYCYFISADTTYLGTAKKSLRDWLAE